MKRDDGETETAQLEEPSPADSAPHSIDHDDGLILWMLSLSPEKRLEVAQGFVDSVRILRSGRCAELALETQQAGQAFEAG